MSSPKLLEDIDNKGHEESEGYGVLSLLSRISGKRGDVEFKSILRCVGRFFKDQIIDLVGDPEQLSKDQRVAAIERLTKEILSASQTEFDDRDLKLISSFIANVCRQVIKVPSKKSIYGRNLFKVYINCISGFNNRRLISLLNNKHFSKVMLGLN